MESSISVTMSWLDWGIVALAFGFIAWIGARVAKRQTSTEHYFVAQRRIPGWAMGMSMFATLISSFTFIASPGWGYDRDWQVLVRESMAPFCVLFCAILIIPIYRRAIRTSAYEYLEKRFGYIGRFYGTLGFLAGHFFKVGVVLFAMSVAVSGISGFPIMMVILVLGVVTVTFTFLGGIEGVVWTDVVQGFIMLGTGVLVILFLLFVATPGEPARTFIEAWSADKFRFLDFTFSPTEQTFWVFAWFGVFHFLTKYATDQTMVQRYLVSPSVKDTVKGTFIGLGCCALSWLIFYGIGSLLWGYYHVFPERLGAHIAKGDEVFPFFIATQLPMGLPGLILAGMFSAGVSTLSSDLNSIGACVTSDFFERFSPNLSERANLIISKLTVLFSGVLIVLFALGMTFWKGSIMDFVLKTSGYIGAIVGGGVLGMFILGFFTRRCNRQGMYVGLGMGGLFTLWALVSRVSNIALPIRYTWSELWLPGFSNILVMSSAYVASVLIDRHRLAPLELTIYGYNVYSHNADSPPDPDSAPDATPVEAK